MIIHKIFALCMYLHVCDFCLLFLSFLVAMDHLLYCDDSGYCINNCYRDSCWDYICCHSLKLKIINCAMIIILPVTYSIINYFPSVMITITLYQHLQINLSMIMVITMIMLDFIKLFLFCIFSNNNYVIQFQHFLLQ